LVGIIVIQLLVSVSTNSLPEPIAVSLVEITKNVTTVLGGAISAIIGFYFAQRPRSRAGTPPSGAGTPPSGAGTPYGYAYGSEVLGTTGNCANA
jgi:hypothetical protein